IDAGTQPRGKQVRKPGGIFYTASTGIWQTVWLEPVPQVSIESLKVDVAVDRGLAHARVKLRGEVGKGYSLRGDIRGRDFGSTSTDKMLSPPAAVFSVPEPKLWSPESPTLYDIDLTLVGPDGKPVDRVRSYVAFRRIELKKDDKGVTRLHL